MEARHLVVREEALCAASLGNGERVLLRMLDHHRLEDRRDASANACIARGAEPRDRPALQRLQHIRIRDRREDGSLLCREGENGLAVIRRPYAATEGVEGADGSVALDERQREAAEGDCANVDTIDDVHEVGVDILGLLEAAEKRTSWEQYVRKCRDRMGKGVRAAAEGEESVHLGQTSCSKKRR